MSRILDRLGPQSIEGEVMPPLPSLEQEAEAFLQMVQVGRELHAALRRANNRTQRLNRQIDDLCLALGHKLIDMRERVEAGEAGDEAALAWWEWFADFIPDVSRKHAERWMSIASQVEPATAAVEYRQRDAAYQRAYRQRQKPEALEPPSDGAASEGDGPLAEAEPLPPPLRPVRDYLAEAAEHKAEILWLMEHMRPVERTVFRQALVEDVEAMERRLNN
jgi:hypothetical protein